MLKLLTAGESHGPALTAIIEGFPANFPVDVEKINHELKRRQGGYGRGGRMKIESDRVQVLSGIRGGKTLGSPITLMIHNRDWENWKDYMDPFNPPVDSSRTPVCPRPGHADMAGALKYNQEDFRNILERASARETAARTAAGALAKQLLSLFNVSILSRVIQVGRVRSPESEFPLDKIQQIEASPVRCSDPEISREMIKAIEKAKQEGDTLGGVFEITAAGLPPGLGSHVQWDRRLDARLAAALMSVPAIKGVEIGEAFNTALTKGSEYHDEIYYNSSRGIYRTTNHAGGLEGGITNGENIVIRAFMKPIPTLSTPLRTIHWQTRKATTAFRERSDVCAVPAASVVGENVIAWELAKSFLEKFAGDVVEDIIHSYNHYAERLRKHGFKLKPIQRDGSFVSL